MNLKKLEVTVQNFTSTLPGAIFTYINSYEIDSEDLSNQGNWPRFFFLVNGKREELLLNPLLPLTN
jgi:hypothetical protein